MADTQIINITSDTVDTSGNYLLGSNDVLSVYYYNVTATGISWTTDWNIADPVSNGLFSNDISASDWVYDTDGSGDIEICRFAGWKSDDLVAGLSVTSSGSHSPYSDDYMTDYYNDYGWETSNATPSGAFAATIDMGSVKDFDYIHITPGWDTDTTKFIKDYRIGVSDTGGEDDFTIVYTGTTSGTVAPEIAFVGNDVSGRYVKLYVDSNYGSGSYTRVGKFSVFNNPDWSMFGYRNYNSAAGSTYAEWKQDILLSGIDYLFFDVRGYNSNTYQIGEIEVVVDSDVKYTYDWAATGDIGWKDTVYDDGWWTRLEEAIDVSAYSGAKTVEFKIWAGSQDRTAFMGFVDNVSVQPRWYSESFSSSRGTKAEFPAEVFIVSDRQGISIIDESDSRLWMRFEVGPGKAVESTARDIFAGDGKIYLATSRGLIILDFVQNRVWKYDETGIYYRMSIEKRNEYAFWFTHSLVDTMASSDIYSVHGGYWKESDLAAEDTLNVLVGTGAGFSVIFPSNLFNSSFSYAVRKIRKYEDRIIYIGGFGSLSRVGVMEDIDALWLDAFSEQTVLYSSVDMMHDDTFNGVIDEQWFNGSGNVPIAFDGEGITISGTKTDYGNTTLIQKEFVPGQPFSASVDVRIADWSDRVEGGLRFGVTSGWPYNTYDYNDSDKAFMLGAINGTVGPYLQNESFSSFPSANNWVQSFTDWDGQTVTTEDGAYKVSGLLGGSYGTSYSTGPVTGSKYYYPAVGDFIARLKVKVTDMYDPDVGRVIGFVFGVTDGQYLGQGTGTTGLAMALHGDNSDPNPAVYCTAHKTNDGGWIWNTTVSGSMFAGDGTASADWHQWEIRYDESSNTLYGSVDDIDVGSITYGSIGTNLGIVFGPVGNQIDNVEVFYKDFEIDFGEYEGNQKKKYVLHSYDTGVWSIPTISGTHLGGLDFYSTDDTDSAEWRTWNITYDGTTFSGSVGGEAVSSSISGDLGDHPRLFITYDAPATQSGTEKDVAVYMKNFVVDYGSINTVVSGSPNSFYITEGVYNTVNYDGLYLATTSGVEQLLYDAATSVSGTPDNRFFYSVSGGGAGEGELIFGNVKNCSAVESATGVAGPTGLLYTGSSKYQNMGWTRLKDRPSEEEPDLSMSIGCLTDASKLFVSINRSGGSSHYIYLKDVDPGGSDWYPIAQAQATTFFQDMQDSRVFGWDLEDGDIYFVGPSWFGIYDIVGKKWRNLNENLGSGYVGVGGGVQFDDAETTASLARKEIFLAHNGYMDSFNVAAGNWFGGKLFYNSKELPLTTADPAIVYSDVDNSLYLMQYSSTGLDNFFRMPLETNIFSSSLPDCPVPFSFDAGISAFYRPYDESIYFLMLGVDPSIGRKLVRYDVKAGQWEAWGIDVPASSYDYLTGSYSYKEDSLYIVVGSESARIYRYMFPRDVSSRYVYWDATDGVLPEDSTSARFNRKSLTSGYVLLGQDSFSDSDTGTNWCAFDTTDGANTSVVEDDTDVTFSVSYAAGSAQASVCSPRPIPPCDFSASAKVRIRDIRKPDTPSSNNNFVFGVTDYLNSPGYFSGLNGENQKGNTMVGVNGLWMMSFNDQSTSDRYSVWKREQGTSTKYTATSYDLFNVTDGTPSADYRDWRLEYTHSTKSFEAYLDDTLLGSASFTGNGFEHGMMINIGAISESTSVSGVSVVDVKDFEITADNSASIVSNYLLLEDSDLNGYNYYEKYDTTLSSGIDYTFESECRFINDSVSSNVYLSTIGCVEDGHKKALLASISTGTRQIGVYSGGDPTQLTSYTGLVAQDWSVQSTYTMTHEDDRLKVYVDGASTPSIDLAYTSLPECNDKKVSFGSMNPYEPIIRNHFDKNDNRVTVSGTWDNADTSVSSYHGSASKKLSVSSDAVIFRFNSSGDAKVFAFYESTTGNSPDAPYTIYHGGVVSLPTADSYATNPINTVNDNTNESGVTDPNTTTVDINQTRLCDGTLYSDTTTVILGSPPSGWVYLGTYTDVDRVVLTANATSGYVFADAVKISHNLDRPKSIFDARIYNVGYTVGETQIKTDSDYVGAFSVIDMNERLLIDAYNDETTPDIVGSNISDLDVIQ